MHPARPNSRDQLSRAAAKRRILATWVAGATLPGMRHTADVRALNFAWLLRLRWSAIAGQLVTIAGVQLTMGYALPLGWLAAIIGLEAATNLAAHRYAQQEKPPSESAFVALLIVDLLALTGLLYLTGGAHNPFNFLYLVYIALASIVLRSGQTWALTLLSAGLFGALFIQSVPLERPAPDPVEETAEPAPKNEHHHHHGGDAAPKAEEPSNHDAHAGHDAHDGMSEHLRGMWVAFCVAAVFIVYFVTRVSRSLAQRDAELARARELALRSERLVSLGTLAAGAAHELGTPLSTIKLVAAELERALAAGETPDDLLEDTRLILGEVQRCREVLDQLSADAGRTSGEGLTRMTLQAIVSKVLKPVSEANRVEIGGDPTIELSVYPRAFIRVLRSLVKNGLAASEDGVVTITGRADGDTLGVTVVDTGAGMTEDVLAHATEPFFTTRPTGEGMGLGLFLARSVVEGLDGWLTIESAVGRGTTASITLPQAAGDANG